MFNHRWVKGTEPPVRREGKAIPLHEKGNLSHMPQATDQYALQVVWVNLWCE